MSKKERIKIDSFIEEYKKLDEEFAECCENDSPKNAVMTSLLDDFWEINPKFSFKRIDVITEKGDGRDEETTTGIFQRKSDKKYFQLWVHDAGQIGPSTLTMSGFLEEVIKETKVVKKTNWK